MYNFGHTRKTPPKNQPYLNIMPKSLNFPYPHSKCLNYKDKSVDKTDLESRPLSNKELANNFFALQFMFFAPNLI